MHRIRTITAVSAFVLFVVLAVVQTAEAQYLPGVYDPYLSWGAYPALNYGAATRTIYAEKSAAERQSLAQMQQRHQAQNQFLLSQSRGQSAFAAENTRAASEAWIRANQPRQTVVYAQPRPAPPQQVREPLPSERPQTAQSGKSYDDIIDWPSLLRGSTFRAQRVRIETIMTKAQPDGPGLSKSDYEDVVRSVDVMKSSLDRMAAGLNAAEYIGVVRYLDNLTQKARSAVKK